jgi:hypothetical protein
MRKLIFVCLLVSILILNAAAQNADKNQTNEAWEYLIVSVSSFNNWENSNVPNKWIGRKQGNVGFFQETQVQNEFDRLGRLGWELVGILPSNTEVNNMPSFQFSKFVFKRRYDAGRSRREADEQTKLLAELKNNPPTAANSELIELDRAEFAARENEATNRVKTRFEQSLKGSAIKFEISRFQYNSQNKRIIADIVVDASSALLQDGNKYRLSEAKKYIEQIAEEIFNKIGLARTIPGANFYSEFGNFEQQGNVYIRLHVSVGSGKMKRTVVQGYITGNWSAPE